MLAVGAVVINRVRSGAYPSTVYDVIYASGQFTPAKTGSLSRVYNQGPKQICLQAAQEALNGYTNVGDMTHFRRAGTREGFVIGHHVFY
ncbi:MAG: cell wall hydrolase [Lachnospiraceae bacterium]|nr:cell wall hydrolase [Lachnospiraceae bacterium]